MKKTMQTVATGMLTMAAAGACAHPGHGTGLAHDFSHMLLNLAYLAGVGAVLGVVAYVARKNS